MVLATVNDAEIPFVSKMAATGYDWMRKTDAVSESALNGILRASGFTGRVVGFDATNSSMMIENTGFMKAAVATSIQVNMKCFPIPGKGDLCPPTISVTVPENSRGDPAFDIEVPRSLTSTGNGTIYTLAIPAKRN